MDAGTVALTLGTFVLGVFVDSLVRRSEGNRAVRRQRQERAEDAVAEVADELFMVFARKGALQEQTRTLLSTYAKKLIDMPEEPIVELLDHAVSAAVAMNEIYGELDNAPRYAVERFRDILTHAVANARRYRQGIRLAVAPDQPKRDRLEDWLRAPESARVEDFQ